MVSQRDHDLGEWRAFFSVVFKLRRRPRHGSLPAESCRVRHITGSRNGYFTTTGGVPLELKGTLGTLSEQLLRS